MVRGGSTEGMAMITGLNHLTLGVADLERAFRFYVELLGCRAMARWNRGAYIVAGGVWLCLSLDEQIGSSSRPGYTHIAFSVDAPRFAEATARLIGAGVVAWKENRSEGDSFYFLDPDGHRLELHVGDLASRLASCRENPYEDMVFFD
jgi:glutathione S-transferase fosA5